MVTKQGLVGMKAQWTVAVSLLVGMGVVAIGLSQPASAQLSTVQPLQDFQNPDNPDPFSSRGNGQASGVMDLINRTLLGPTRSLEEFSADQQESLDSAAEQFRAEQMKRLRNPGQVAPETPAPAESNPGN